MKSRKLTGDKIFDAVNFTFLTLFFLVVLYPCIFVISSSFSSIKAVTAGLVRLFPVGFSLEGYKAVFQNQDIWRGYLNSLIYVVLGTSLNLVMTTFAAYPLSRKDFSARKVIMPLFVFTMYFSGGLVPTYMMIKSFGMVNKISVMVIPVAMSVWNVILMRTFYQSTISDSLLEAAQLDGCNDFRFLLKIVIPLSKPIFAVIGLYCTVGIWNEYFQAMIYLRSPELHPLQIVLRNILIMNQMQASSMTHVSLGEMENKQGMANLIKYALIIVASLPVLMAYPFVQKYFVKGVMIGSLKG